jgi:hypothetical protein
VGNLNTHFEITISPRMLRMIEDLRVFQDIVRKHKAALHSDHGGAFDHEMQRILEMAENLSFTWKRMVVDQINDQFKNSDYLNGMIAVREMPFTKKIHEDD